jgi:hypothetical protein
MVGAVADMVRAGYVKHIWLSKTQPGIAGKAKDHPLIDPKALGPSQGLLRVPPRRRAV